jgi:hypothetical protein
MAVVDYSGYGRDAGLEKGYEGDLFKPQQAKSGETSSDDESGDERSPGEAPVLDWKSAK